MATYFNRCRCRSQRFSFKLLSLSLSAGILISTIFQPAKADVVIQEDVVPVPENVSPAQQSSAQQSIEQKASEAGSQELPRSSSNRISASQPSHVSTTLQNSGLQPKGEQPAVAASVTRDPKFYKSFLPPLGDGTTYLPSEADALGLHLVVKLHSRRVYLYKGDKVIASYPIAVGKPGWETPVGDYKVFNMEKNPIFKSFKSGQIIYPGPENPLGVRWIGIWTDGKTQLGFHGTNQPELIGQAVSHGCIRMLNKDVTALFDQVAIGTPVKVVP